MSVAAPETKIPLPEQRTSPGLEISAAFAVSKKRLYPMLQDNRFHAACKGAGINLETDTDTPGYWRVVADFAGAFVEKAHAMDGDSLSLRTFELLALTPDYLYTQQALDRAQRLNLPAPREAKERVSYFNSALRIFATEFPDARASTVLTSLLGTANSAIEDKYMRQSAVLTLKRAIRGAQHEMAFGQILKHTGRHFTTTSLQEDLDGIDYIVDGASGEKIYVDVKASAHKLKAEGELNELFVRRPHNKVIMQSLVTDRDLNDRFFISDDLAAQKALALNRLLSEAESTRSWAM